MAKASQTGSGQDMHRLDARMKLSISSPVKIDIVSYLADVLVRVATHPASRVEELLPDRWAKLVASERLVESVAQ
jgi:hypothetical protein